MSRRPGAEGAAPAGARAVVAVDVGGTSMKGAVVGRHGKVLVADSRPTMRERGADAVVERIRAFAADLAARAREHTGAAAAAAGIAVPGLVDEAAGVATYSANIGWRDVPIRELVARGLGVPVALGHDVRAGGLAEARLGAGRGADDFLFLPIGTGIAGAAVLRGVPYPGSRGWGGEIGHAPVWPDGEPCACGQRGCLETYASAASIARRYAEATRDHGAAARNPGGAGQVHGEAGQDDGAAGQVQGAAVRNPGAGQDDGAAGQVQGAAVRNPGAGQDDGAAGQVQGAAVRNPGAGQDDGAAGQVQGAAVRNPGAGQDDGVAGHVHGAARQHPGGAAQDRGAPGQDHGAVGQDPGGAGQNPGTGQILGAGQDPGGAGQDRGGAGQDRGGAGQDRGGAGQDRGGAGQDDGGAGQGQGGAAPVAGTAEYVVDRVGTDPAAARVWGEAVEALAIALAGYTLTLDPGLVVVGGGLAGCGERLFEPLRARLAARLAFREPPPVEPAMLGPRAATLGAALLAWQAAGVPDAGGDW